MIKFLFGRGKLRYFMGTKFTFPMPRINNEVFDDIKYELNNLSTPFRNSVPKGLGLSESDKPYLTKKYNIKNQLCKYKVNSPLDMVDNSSKCREHLNKINSEIGDLLLDDNTFEINEIYCGIFFSEKDIRLQMADNREVISVKKLVKFWRENKSGK